MNFKSCAVFVLLNACGAALALGDVPPNQTVHLTNGATAVSYNHCGDNDLCARIGYQEGSALLIYSEGAALCQPHNCTSSKVTLRDGRFMILREPLTTRYLKDSAADIPFQQKWCSIGATSTCW